MIDALSPQLLAANVPAAAPTTAPDLVPPVAGDAEQFRALMRSQEQPAQTSAPAPTASELGRPLAVAQEAPASSIGQSILDTMQSLSADTRARFAQAEQVLAKPNLTMSDLLSLQFTLLQTSVQFEIASKGISKLTQNVESVLKTQ